MKLIRCPVCARHVRATEQRCVFCSHALAGGLCLALALTAGCKANEVNSAAPPAPTASTSAGPPVSQPLPAPASAEVALPSASAIPSAPPEAIGLGNIGSVGVYGGPPLPSDAGVPNTRMVLSSAQFTGPAVPQADDVLGAAMSGFRRCYVRELQKNPRLAGTISAKVELGKGGELTSVTTEKTAGLSEGVRTCIAARLSTLKFQPPEGGLPTVLQFTLKCDAQPR